jgi:hypothetical protein
MNLAHDAEKWWALSVRKTGKRKKPGGGGGVGVTSTALIITAGKGAGS